MSEIDQQIRIPTSDRTMAWVNGLGDRFDPQVQEQIDERFAPIVDALIDLGAINVKYKYTATPIPGGNGVERTIEVVMVFPGLEYDSSARKITMNLECPQAFNRF